jgi:hypothetical protein
MESRKYTVCRDDIYVGSVVRTDRVYRYDGVEPFFNTQPGELDTGAYREYRTMLFVPDQNNFANDLLYNSPNYTALNVTDDAISLAINKETIILKDNYNLSELLKYFGYPEELGYEQVMEIRKRFFTGHFAMDNCELFGWKESMPQDFTYYKNGEQITNPAKLRLIQLKQEISRRMGHRMFSGVEHAELDRRLWDILDKMGDNSIMDVLNGFDERMNAFKPHKEEVNVFKLTR